MPEPLTFDIEATSGNARVGRVHTIHGSFATPAFMPVGTRASVKGILPHMVRQGGAEVLLNNTYHLMLRPGSELIRDMGGVHKFMNWDGPILTDSGGYQAYSMADINAIDEDGVSFKSILDGSMVRLNPEIAMRVQNELGPDIMMAFDDCPPSVDPDSGEVNQPRLNKATSRDTKKKSVYDHAARLTIANQRTVRWLERCKQAHARPSEQSLFGIIQGGADLEMRDWSVERICNIDLPGYAIGGVAVGESTEDIARIVRHTAPQMPAAKPRYLMGGGYEHDITMWICLIVYCLRGMGAMRTGLLVSLVGMGRSGCGMRSLHGMSCRLSLDVIVRRVIPRSMDGQHLMVVRSHVRIFVICFRRVRCSDRSW